MSTDLVHSQIALMEDLLVELRNIFTKNVNLFSEIIEKFVVDAQIIAPGIVLPAHKYVLSSRSDVFAKAFASGINELDWNAYDRNVGIALLRWIYTDKIVAESKTLKLGLLRASHHFQLPTLFEACERELLSSIDETCSREFYEIAMEVNADKLLEKCVKIDANLTQIDDSTSSHRMQIDVGVSSKSCKSCNLDLDDLDEVSREEMNLILKRKEELESNCMKMDKSLLGIKEYLDFFDTSIWSWPAHTYVLCARSENFRDKILSDGLNWSGLSENVERAFKRWLYTDVICLNSASMALDLLQASHEYELHSLFTLCEQEVIKRVNVTSCALVHSIATKVDSAEILKYCSRIASVFWDVSQSQSLEVAADVVDPANVETPMRKLPLEGAGTLLTLNDDCLLHLFRFITLVDLGCIKDTCTKLNQLADQSFKLYGDKSLTITRNGMVADVWNLRHFGKHLKSVTLNDCYDRYGSLADVFKMIGRYCGEQLESICLCLHYDQSITAENLQCLERVLKNVKRIELNAFYNESHIELLLSYCQNLIEIHINGDELELKTLWCSKHLNVKSVTVSGLLCDDIFEEICGQLINLESFEFDYIPNTNNKIHLLSQLNHLKRLKIENYYDNIGNQLTPLFENLAKKNVLECLSISCFEMDELAAVAIGDFTKLKQLIFEGGTFSGNILNIFAEKLNSIEKLTFIDCDEITFGDITKIIENQLNFKEVTVSECESIEFVDRHHYQRLKKRRELQIFLDSDVYETTMKLIANDLSDYVKIKPRIV